MADPMTAGEPPLPYGAVEGQSAPRPLASGAVAGGPWRSGAAVVFRPKRFLVVAMALAAAILMMLIWSMRSAPTVVPALYGGLLVIAVVILAEALYGQVRIEPFGITRRSIRGTKSFQREELDTAVLHTYYRRTRGGRQQVARLSIRRAGGRYGFMITSDLYAYADVKRMADRVGAATRSGERGVDIEAAYPGATLWAHRHPVLVGLLIGVLTWVACAVYLMVAI